MRKPELPDELQTQLEHLIGQHFDAVDAGKTSDALAAIAEAWALVPEPKSSWDYYSQVLPQYALDLTCRAGHSDDAESWLDLIDQALQPHNDASRMMLTRHRGKVLLLKGDTDQAWSCFHTIYSALGRHGFGSDEQQYLDFYLKHTTSQGSSRLPDPGVDGPGLDKELPRALGEHI